jgi:hypothetical protein
MTSPFEGESKTNKIQERALSLAKRMEISAWLTRIFAEEIEKELWVTRDEALGEAVRIAQMNYSGIEAAREIFKLMEEK